MVKKNFLIRITVIVLFFTSSFFVYYAYAQSGRPSKFKQQLKTPNISELSALEYEMLIFEKRADLLLNKVDDLLKEIEHLRSKNNEYARLLALKDNDVDKVRKELTQKIEIVKKELDKELSDNKELRATIAEQSSEIKNLKEQLASKKKEIAALKNTLSVKDRQAASELVAKENLLKEKTNELFSLQNTHKAIKDENLKNKKELAVIKKKLDRRDEEFRILRNQLSKQKEAFRAEVAKKNKLLRAKDSQLRRFDRENRQYKREIASYLSTIGKLKEKLQASQQHIASLQKKLVAKDKPAAFYSQKAEPKTQPAASEVAELQELLSQQRSTIESLQARLAAKELPAAAEISDASSQLEKEVEIKNAQLKQLAAKLASRDDELFALQKKLLSIQKELAALKADKNTKASNVRLKDDKIAKLNSQLNIVQERFKKAVLDYKRRIERLEKELVAAKKMLSRKPQEQIAEEDVSKEKFSEKEQELRFLHNRLQQARLAHQELTLKLKQQKQDYQKQLSDLQRQLSRKEQLIEQLQAESRSVDTPLRSQQSSLPAGQQYPSKDKESTLAAADEASSSGSKRKLARVRDVLKAAFQDEIADLRMRLTLTKDNLMVSVLADVLFDSGSDEIRLSSIPLLNTIGKVFNDEAREFQIIVEGHTDNQPIRYSKWKSNWELSSARALSVLHYFINECGINSSRLSMCGFGEFKPVASNDTEAGRQRNRRVEIILVPRSEFSSVSSPQ